MQYEWDCAEQLESGRSVRTGLELQVRNADDGSFVETQPRTKRTGTSGKGTLRYARPGAYVVSGATECNLTLQVRQGSQEES